jgi:hypothetical protein
MRILLAVAVVAAMPAGRLVQMEISVLANALQEPRDDSGGRHRFAIRCVKVSISAGESAAI